MTARRLVEIGFTRGLTRKLGTSQRGATRAIHREWASTRTGRSPGRQIAAFFTIAPRATVMESLGIPQEGKFGGMRQARSGLAMMFLTSRSIPSHRITWARSL